MSFEAIIEELVREYEVPFTEAFRAHPVRWGITYLQTD